MQATRDGVLHTLESRIHQIFRRHSLRVNRIVAGEIARYAFNIMETSVDSLDPETVQHAIREIDQGTKSPFNGMI